MARLGLAYHNVHDQMQNLQSELQKLELIVESYCVNQRIRSINHREMDTHGARALLKVVGLAQSVSCAHSNAVILDSRIRIADCQWTSSRRWGR